MHLSQRLSRRRLRLPLAVLAAALLGLLSLAALATGPEAGALQLTERDVVAISGIADQDGDDSIDQVHVSWLPISDESPSYVIKWKPQGSSVRYQPTDTLVLDGARHSFTFTEAITGGDQVLWVEIKQADAGPGNWSNRADAIEGQVVDVQTELQNDGGVMFQWQPSLVASQAGAENAVERYAAFGRNAEDPDTVQYIGKAEKTDLVPDNEFLLTADIAPDFDEVFIRAIYWDGDVKAETGWVPVPSGSLTDECREGGTVYDKIGASGEYDEPRIPLETQVWFFPTEESEGGTDTGKSFGHAHLLTCVPHLDLGEGSTIEQHTLDLDLEVVMHLNAAQRQNTGIMNTPPDDIGVRVNAIEIRGRTVNWTDILVHRLELPELPACTLGTTCKQQISLSSTGTYAPVQLVHADGQGFTSNGVKELRIAAIHDVYRTDVSATQPVASMRGIMRFPFALDVDQFDGAGSDDVDPVTESAGWLIEEDRNGAGGYATVAVDQRGADGTAFQLPIQALPADEDWVIPIYAVADPCVRNCQVDFMPVRRLWAFIDPHFHDHDGRCLDGTNSTCKIARWDIDAPPAPTSDPCAPATAPDRFAIPEPAPYAENLVISATELAVLERGVVHKLVLSVEQPMVSGQPGTIDLSDGVGAYDRGCNPDIGIEEDWQSTLSGLLVIRFIVAE